MLSEKHFNLRPFKNRENGMLKNKRNNNDRNIHRNSTLIQNKTTIVLMGERAPWNIDAWLFWGSQTFGSRRYVRVFLAIHLCESLIKILHKSQSPRMAFLPFEHRRFLHPVWAILTLGPDLEKHCQTVLTSMSICCGTQRLCFNRGFGKSGPLVG